MKNNLLDFIIIFIFGVFTGFLVCALAREIYRHKPYDNVQIIRNVKTIDNDKYVFTNHFGIRVPEYLIYNEGDSVEIQLITIGHGENDIR